MKKGALCRQYTTPCNVDPQRAIHSRAKDIIDYRATRSLQRLFDGVGQVKKKQQRQQPTHYRGSTGTD